MLEIAGDQWDCYHYDWKCMYNVKRKVGRGNKNLNFKSKILFCHLSSITLNTTDKQSVTSLSLKLTQKFPMLSKIWTSPLLIPNTMFFPSGDHSTFVSCKPFNSFPQILFPSTEPTITAPSIQNTNSYQTLILCLIILLITIFSQHAAQMNWSLPKIWLVYTERSRNVYLIWLQVPFSLISLKITKIGQCYNVH